MAKMYATTKDGKKIVVDTNDPQVKEVLEANKAKKAAKRQERKDKAKKALKAVGEYAKSRWDRSMTLTKDAADTVSHIKDPGRWANLGKDVVKGEIDNVKNIGKMVKDIFNHPSYYEHYPELLNLMITPNFAKISGVVDPDLPLDMSGATGNGAFPFFDGTFSVPKVCAISLKLTRGSSSRKFRLAIDRLYQAVQNANNGNASGTMEEYAELILITRELIALIEEGRRAYGTLKRFDILDESVPQAYFAAYGLDYKTFRNNSANLMNFLNDIIREFNSRAIFNIDLFKRTVSLFRGHYQDNPTIKHQVYVFRPIEILTWSTINEEIEVVNAAYDGLSATATGMTYTNYITAVQNAIDKLTSKKSYADIRANIIKAFGLDLCQLPYIDPNYISEVNYSEYMLQAIQNATLCGSPIQYASNLVTGTSPRLLDTDESYTGAMATNQNYFDNLYINTLKDKVTNSEFISSTRLVTCGKLGGAGGITPILDSFGTEIAFEAVVPMVVTPATVTALSGNTDYNLVLFRYSRLTEADFTGGSPYDLFSVGQYLIAPFLWATFDWHPMIGVNLDFGEKGDYSDSFYVSMWDYANYTTVDHKQMDTYHAIAVQNLLFAPLIYKPVKTEVIPAK